MTSSGGYRLAVRAISPVRAAGTSRRKIRRMTDAFGEQTVFGRCFIERCGRQRVVDQPHAGRDHALHARNDQIEVVERPGLTAQSAALGCRLPELIDVVEVGEALPIARLVEQRRGMPPARSASGGAVALPPAPAAVPPPGPLAKRESKVRRASAGCRGGVIPGSEDGSTADVHGRPSGRVDLAVLCPVRCDYVRFWMSGHLTAAARMPRASHSRGRSPALTLSRLGACSSLFPRHEERGML